MSTSSPRDMAGKQFIDMFLLNQALPKHPFFPSRRYTIKRDRNLRLSSLAELSDLVLDRRPLVALGAVVVASQDISVDVAHADEVIGLLVAALDAGLVACDTGVDDAMLMSAIIFF